MPVTVPPGHQVARMPGHMGQLFTLVTQDKLTGPATHSKGHSLPDICIKPMMEIFFDANTRAYLAVLQWGHLRVLHPILLPWPRTQKMTDVSPDV